MILTRAVTFGLLFKKQGIENNAFFVLTFTRSKSRKNHACSAGHEKPVKKRKMQMVLRVRGRTINKEGIFNHVLGETLKRKKTQVSHLLCRICLAGHKRTRQCSRTLLTHQYIRDGSIGLWWPKRVWVWAAQIKDSCTPVHRYRKIALKCLRKNLKISRKLSLISHEML